MKLLFGPGSVVQFMLHIHTKCELLDWFQVLLEFPSDENPVSNFLFWMSRDTVIKNIDVGLDKGEQYAKSALHFYNFNITVMKSVGSKKTETN